MYFFIIQQQLSFFIMPIKYFYMKYRKYNLSVVLQICTTKI